MKTMIDFGVQSYCLRHFKDPAVVAEKVRAIGVDKVELCAVHADFDDLEAFGGVVDLFRAQGVSIVSLGVQAFHGEEKERTWFEAAVAAGAGHISAHFAIDTFQRAIPKVRRWSREFGVRVGIHCHGGYAFGGQPGVMEYLVSLGTPEIGVCIDTAWALQIGPRQGNPVEWAKRFAGQVYGVHFKDFVFDRDGQWHDVVVGTGNLDLPAFAGALQEGGFDGMAVIEYEADVENPEPALTKCVESMRAALQ